MKILILFFVSISSFSPAEDFFFRNIKDKPLAQKISLLRKRIKKDSYSSHRLTTRENVISYLEVDANVEEKFRFVNEVISQSSQDTFKAEAIAGLFNYCQNYLEKCIPYIQQYLECNNVEKCAISYPDAQILFTPENLESIIKRRNLFLKTLDYNGSDVELAKMLYRHAVNFGFLESAEKLLKTHPSAQEDLVVKQYMCTYYFLKKEYNRATECALEAKDPWAKLIVGYVVLLKGEKLNETEYELLLKELVDSSLARPRYFAIAMSGFLLKKMVHEVPSSDIDGVAKDYWNGFILLAVNKKHNFLKPIFQKQLEEKFKANFPNSLLLKIYLGIEMNGVLKQGLGENSFLYQASK